MKMLGPQKGAEPGLGLNKFSSLLSTECFGAQEVDIFFFE